MAVTIVFETHSWSEDNDNGIASGWNKDGSLPTPMEKAGQAPSSGSAGSSGIDDSPTADVEFW